MSVFVNVGQCGNQVGGALIALAKEPKGKERKSNKSHMRCILVDTEPKVVRSIRAPSSISAVHMEQSGRGNNWAMGYARSKSVVLGEHVMESLRREIEATDCYRGAVLLHSLAGGTGSGLGSRLLENIRDTYPKAYIVSGCIAPSLCGGDTPLQNYNALFTLRHLQEYADAVLLKDNDDVMRSVSHWTSISTSSSTISSSTSQSSEKVSLGEMNALVAADWAGLLFPITSPKTKLCVDFDMGGFVSHVCPLPQAKFVDVRSAYFVSKQSSKVPYAQRLLAGHHDSHALTRQVVASFPRTSAYSSLGQVVVARGFKDLALGPLVDIVRKGIPRVDWGIPLPHAIESASALDGASSSSITVCSNGTNVVPTVETLLARARHQFQARAYLHWFAKYGIDCDDFTDSFERTQAIVDEYSALNAPE
ncbi:hypothetical protein H310_06809 [Aphanomyces invadans]|uniref:Tubulin delta chain n=1 Tax=Aphanomyces invadans TaxID=157072 RepID=A0A024U4Q4_9STRA|nr:hypothetical protein H310_06809 [Aphanomyces invadans]ETW01220.1 hypothetical protein H310_06809 [Aphanomyces invadans]|eukprot:XP_008870218.1 hypothetical protein H310_06809 [Aphanomyces invadans]